MKLGHYILRRLLLMIPTLFGITLICFLVVQLAPGGPVEQKLQKIRFGASSKGSAPTLGVVSRSEHGVSEETVKALQKQYGFDKPVLERYALWLRNLARLEFGESFSYGEPAMQVIKERFPVSLQFGISSFILTYLVSVSLGLAMAYRENRSLDRISSFLLVVTSSIPPFTLAILMLVLLAGGSFMDLFPIGYLHSDDYETLSFWGKVADRAHHFVLPLICYMMGSFTALSLLCRNSVLDEIGKDYIRTARAKGVGEFRIYLKHALRNALVPITTGIGGILSVFLSGSILIENIFQLNGIGQLGFQSLMARDYNVIMALIFLSSVALLIGNLVGDLVYVLVDPRVDFR